MHSLFRLIAFPVSRSGEAVSVSVGARDRLAARHVGCASAPRRLTHFEAMPVVERRPEFSCQNQKSLL